MALKSRPAVKRYSAINIFDKLPEPTAILPDYWLRRDALRAASVAALINYFRAGGGSRLGRGSFRRDLLVTEKEGEGGGGLQVSRRVPIRDHPWRGEHPAGLPPVTRGSFLQRRTNLQDGTLAGRPNGNRRPPVAPLETNKERNLPNTRKQVGRLSYKSRISIKCKCLRVSRAGCAAAVALTVGGHLQLTPFGGTGRCRSHSPPTRFRRDRRRFVNVIDRVRCGKGRPETFPVRRGPPLTANVTVTFIGRKIIFGGGERPPPIEFGRVKEITMLPTNNSKRRRRFGSKREVFVHQRVGGDGVPRIHPRNGIYSPGPPGNIFEFSHNREWGEFCGCTTELAVASHESRIPNFCRVPPRREFNRKTIPVQDESLTEQTRKKQQQKRIFYDSSCTTPEVWPTCPVKSPEAQLKYLDEKRSSSAAVEYTRKENDSSGSESLFCLSLLCEIPPISGSVPCERLIGTGEPTEKQITQRDYRDSGSDYAASDNGRVKIHQASKSEVSCCHKPFNQKRIYAPPAAVGAVRRRRFRSAPVETSPADRHPIPIRRRRGWKNDTVPGGDPRGCSSRGYPPGTHLQGVNLQVTLFSRPLSDDENINGGNSFTHEQPTDVRNQS
ncbi:hypothetical protein GEV33_013372 [Tenebrio molitor]|uniref:Uncharacterized protein n=1 Tax=Tenebrio molitor TaxID=7067 RepID=A0A8J6H7B3_TENMO|nr:hypothetical protein GEV33_013372 [Tenebrio molitor]